MGLVEFARKLHDFGLQLVASGGTAKAIRNSDIPVKYVFLVNVLLINQQSLLWYFPLAYTTDDFTCQRPGMSPGQ